MSLRTAIASRVADHLTSETRLLARRRKAEAKRRAAGEPHRIDYFHQADDPYSHLAVQALLAVRERYDARIAVHLVGPPADWAAPERAMLSAYARRDAALLAGSAGLTFADPGRDPDPAAVAAANDALAAAGGDLEAVARIGAALWSGGAIPASGGGEDGAAAIAAGEARRAALGHFMSAMIHYGGEWCWGLDRLHYLEERLAGLGARRAGAPAELFYPPPTVPEGGPPAGGELVWHPSFRSPYTYVGAERVKAVADGCGAKLTIRHVLPMAMRGLPVPRMKGMYFTLDAAREARRVGVPFGRIADPLGKPVERGYSLIPWARAQGRDYEYCLSFMRRVWSEGVDAASNRGMRRIVEAAGLDWREAARVIDNDDWRAEAEANRREMTALGLWGVPSFRVGEFAIWGQDRLWAVEKALREGA